MQDFNSDPKSTNLPKLEKRICPHSGIEFTPSRRNQIYADAQCRIAHNNEKSRIKRDSTSEIDKSIRKNYNILLKLMGNEKVKIVHSEYLRGAEFRFGVHTHLTKNQRTGNYDYAVHHFSYCKLNDNYYEIYNNS